MVLRISLRFHLASLAPETVRVTEPICRLPSELDDAILGVHTVATGRFAPVRDKLQQKLLIDTGQHLERLFPSLLVDTGGPGRFPVNCQGDDGAINSEMIMIYL